MSTAFITYFMISMLGIGTIYAENNPCTNYTELEANSTLQATVQTVGWYRFVSTRSGLLATSCPDDDECSSPGGVIWINDTLQAWTEERVNTCVKTSSGCCSETNTIQAKQCDGYAVYQLIYSPSQAVFCFNSSESLPIWTSESTPEQTTQNPVTTVVKETSRGPGETTQRTITQTSRGPGETTQRTITQTSRGPGETTQRTIIQTSRGLIQTTPRTLPIGTSPDWPKSKSTTTTTTQSTETRTMKDDKSSVNPTVIIVVVVVLVAIAIVLVAGWLLYQRRKRKSRDITHDVRMRDQ